VLCRPAGTLFRVWQTDLRSLPASSFKRPQDVAHLRYLPSRERIKKGQYSALCRIVSRRLWDRDEPLRFSVLRVAFAKAIVLQRVRSVVVERRAPEHRAGGHHAVAYVVGLRRMTLRIAAASARDSKIAGIYKLNEVDALLVQQRGGSLRVGRTAPDVVPRLNVSLRLRRFVFGRSLLSAGRQSDFGVASVTIDASQIYFAVVNVL